MPPTLSTRISVLTPNSCEPLIIILPFGNTSVTIAAIDSLMSSVRSIWPFPLIWVLVLMLALAWPLSCHPATSISQASPNLICESRERSVLLSSLALSCIDMITVTTSPVRRARGSR